MKSFACSHCGNKLYFENLKCLKCNHALGVDAKSLNIVAIKPVEGRSELFRKIGGKQSELVRYCSNAAHGVCNWLTPANDAIGLCVACDLNRTIPNLSEWGSLTAWRDMERAKKRLVYGLLRFGLPLDGAAFGKGKLTFDFGRNTVTGHLDGVISVDITEADAVERERQRQYFDEPYRSLLGHLRHESGHFYWMLLVEGRPRHNQFRIVFGDESSDYSDALARHHANGADPNWQARYVSAYASSHPWEDWAETWAHYLHMIDALDTAETEGMDPRSAGFSFGAIWPFKNYDVYRDESFDVLMERWIPLTIAMNRLSRSMGHADFYPFVIPAPAYDKLAFVHRIIREGRAQNK